MIGLHMLQLRNIELTKQFNDIQAKGIEGISNDEYDTSAIECYYDKLYNITGELRKNYEQQRRLIRVDDEY